MLSLILAMIILLGLSFLVIACYFMVYRQWKILFAISLFLPAMTGYLYLDVADGFENMSWLNQRQRHQQLVEQFNQLGSVDEIIVRIQQRLKNNPNDAQGYYLLGRLYQSQNKQKKADQALEKSAAIKRAA